MVYDFICDLSRAYFSTENCQCIQKEKRKDIQKKSTVYLILIAVFFLFWGSSQLLNTPVVESYRFGIYTVAFLLGYYVFSQDIVIEVLKNGGL